MSWVSTAVYNEQINKGVARQLGGLASAPRLRQSERRLKTSLAQMGKSQQQAAILGCTELVMLADSCANVLPVTDTTALHAKAAVDWILA